MKLQPDNFSCGVYAIMNAADCLGVCLQKRDIIKHSGTTEKGTSEDGIKKALSANNLSYREISVSDHTPEMNKTKAIMQLSVAIGTGKPTILAVDKWDHWIVVIGKIGSNYVVFDSNSTKKNKKENGIYVLTIEQLIKRWLFKDSYYGIVVSRG